MNIRKITFYLILLLATVPIISSCTKSLQKSYSPDSDTTPTTHFPAETWMQYETPEEAGWSSEKLSSVEKFSHRAGSAAVMIIYNGAILAQWGQINRRLMCHSVRKSLLSALYGIAVDDGLVDLDETIGSIGIDDAPPLTTMEKSAKVSDLLKARSGVYHSAAYETRAMKSRRPERGSHKPGTHWYYNNWDFNTLATIYNNKTSNDMFESFEKQLAIPLKMQDFELRHTYYHLELENSRHPAYPFRMSARDLARIGLLYLNEGRWMETQIIPPEWIHDSTLPHSTYSNGGYGYMWWTLPERGQLGKLGTFAALGYGGQAVYVVPEANLVFVHRADTYEGRQKHVNNSTIRNILLEVLKARTGPSLPEPKLIMSDNSQTDTSGQMLTKAQSSKLVGKYSKNSFVVTVRDLDGRLESTSTRWGNYFLEPVSSTEFEAVDAKTPVEFVFDATGIATEMRIWFEADHPYVMKRTQ